VLNLAENLLGELPPPFQEIPPVGQISIRGAFPLVEQPEDSFGEYITEFLGPRSLRCPVRVIGLLDDLSYDCDRLQALPPVQQVELVVVIDLGEERAVAHHRDG
jgi:hypothetical protein